MVEFYGNTKAAVDGRYLLLGVRFDTRKGQLSAAYVPLPKALPILIFSPPSVPAFVAGINLPGQVEESGLKHWKQLPSQQQP